MCAWNKIKEIASNDIFQNGVWLYLLQFFNTIIPLFTLPYITRVLGAEYYGLFSAALNFITYFQVVVEYGFGLSATREVVKIKEDKNAVNRLFCTVIYSRLILLFLCAVALGIICLISQDYDKVLCLLVLSYCLLGYCFQQNWLFQGMLEMKYISIINIIARTTSTVLIFIFVHNRSDIFLYCFLYAISPLISGLLGYAIARRRYALTLITLSIKEIGYGLKSGWYVFTTQFSAKVLNIIGITFLGWFTSNFDVGIYSAINKISNLIVLLWMPISQILYPVSSKRLSESFADGIQFVNRMRKGFLTLFGTGILVASVFSKNLVRIAFGREYASFYYLLIPQLFFVIIAINNNFWGSQILLGGGHDKEYSRCFHKSVVVTIMINFVFIRLWGVNGAAFCSLVSEAFLSILLYASIRKLKHEKCLPILP